VTTIGPLHFTPQKTCAIGLHKTAVRRPIKPPAHRHPLPGPSTAALVSVLLPDARVLLMWSVDGAVLTPPRSGGGRAVHRSHLAAHPLPSAPSHHGHATPRLVFPCTGDRKRRPGRGACQPRCCRSPCALFQIEDSEMERTGPENTTDTRSTARDNNNDKATNERTIKVHQRALTTAHSRNSHGSTTFHLLCASTITTTYYSILLLSLTPSLR
jgi:hypothetical protein